MKNVSSWSIFVIALISLSLIVACSSDSDESDSGKTVKVTKDNLTDKGYFDGILYYKITSNSSGEVKVNRVEENAITVVIPTYIIIDGQNFRCTSIGDKAFINCKNLTTVTIPNSVTSMGEYVFRWCLNLTTVVSLIEKPFPIRKDVFLDLSKNITLYVPIGTKDKYEAAEGWKEIANIIEGTGGK